MKAMSGGGRAELVIFDCDGVLVDSEAIYIAAELSSLKAAGLELDRREYMVTYTGMPPKAWQAALAGAAQADFGIVLDAAFFDRLAGDVKNRFESNLAAISGALEMIGGLDRPVCVASSTSLDFLQWKLAHTGLAHLFGNHIYSGDMVARGKPSPDLFEHAAGQMGADPVRCLVVEDSSNGVRAGKAAGMTVIGFTAGGHCLDGHGDDLLAAGADYLAGDYASLSALLAGL